MSSQSDHILGAVLKPTRILWVIPQLFGASLASPLLGGVLAHSLGQPPLFWALCSLILSYGGALYLTFLDEDFLRIKKVRHSLKRTKNHVPTGQKKYMS